LKSLSHSAHKRREMSFYFGKKGQKGGSQPSRKKRKNIFPVHLGDRAPATALPRGLQKKTIERGETTSLLRPGKKNPPPPQKKKKKKTTTPTTKKKKPHKTTTPPPPPPQKKVGCFVYNPSARFFRKRRPMAGGGPGQRCRPLTREEVIEGGGFGGGFFLLYLQGGKDKRPKKEKRVETAETKKG